MFEFNFGPFRATPKATMRVRGVDMQRWDAEFGNKFVGSGMVDCNNSTRATVIAELQEAVLACAHASTL